MLILAATPVYLLALIAAWRAAGAVRLIGGRPSDRRAFVVLGALFAVMIAVRFADAENAFRGALRVVLARDDMYESRRAIQAAVFVFGAALFAWPVWRTIAVGTHRRAAADRWIMWAKLGGLAYLALFATRLLSLHQIDALLYGGPHINRIIDPGLALLVAAMAWQTDKYLRAQPVRGTHKD